MQEKTPEQRVTEMTHFRMVIVGFQKESVGSVSLEATETADFVQSHQSHHLFPLNLYT